MALGGRHRRVLRRLFEEEAGRVYQLAYRMVGDREAAMDFVQETFLRALRSADGMDPTRNLTGWLMRIARNVCIDHLRSRGSRSAVSLAESGVAAVADRRAAAVDARLLGDERRARVKAALARLSDEHRDMLILRDVLDLSYEQIAETLGIPAGTVMSRLHRARQAMRNLMGEPSDAL